MGLRTLSVSLESGEASGEQMKHSLLISGIAEFQKNRLHGTIEAVLLLIVQVFNSFNISPLNILLKGEKRKLSVSLYMGFLG